VLELSQKKALLMFLLLYRFYNQVLIDELMLYFVAEAGY